MKKGPFTVTSTKQIYKNDWMEVREDSVIRPDGTTGIFGVVEYGSNNGGVSILPMDREGNVYLIKQYAYAIEKYETFLPSGGIDEGEDPLTAAKRELMEEIGMESYEWVSLGISNPLSMAIKSPAHLFLALGVIQSGEKEKDIEIIKLSFQDAINQIKSGTITHAGSLNALFKAKLYLEDKS